MLTCTQIATMRNRVSDEQLQLLPEYRQRMEVLRRLGYIRADDTVELKVVA
jgi:superfamily II RNA helicase